MDKMELIPEQPHSQEIADFAILDLAQKDEGLLLGWMYRYFDNAEIPWDPLYQKTELAELWKKGPILIDLRHSPVFREALIERYKTEYLGILISAPDVDLAAMADHLRSIIIVQRDGKPFIFRFYDPRTLGALFEVLEPSQHQQMLGPSSKWTWHHYRQWWQFASLRQTDSSNPARALSITGVQINQMDDVRSRQFALFMAQTYGDYIPAEDVQRFALNEVSAARSAGFSTQVDFERWLRMAIKLGGSLTESDRWQQLAGNGERSPLQILSQLECEQGR
ncbi:MAG: DUF4123 domain-containing protein [Alteromonadaceae bacterium]|uniref:DUF4123 domain-containing protein n=1 Tax=Marinobacter sp. TaxID=50741 RepID=UPI0029C47F46|nr:DUF4123 domain-containing protein [Marinobacter sp.]MDX5385335.1 DUF4123 domain-containing protein [Marinobacter sp.]MDX5441772.1 DUF4123 domain-containing protein [Alteromonadaceae bacterium]